MEKTKIHRRSSIEKLKVPADRVRDGRIEKAYVNEGFRYRDSGGYAVFRDDSGEEYKGLLAEDGTPLRPGEQVVFLWFAIKQLESN